MFAGLLHPAPRHTTDRDILVFSSMDAVATMLTCRPSCRPVHTILVTSAFHFFPDLVTICTIVPTFNALGSSWMTMAPHLPFRSFFGDASII